MTIKKGVVMAYTKKQIEILESHKYNQYVDRCLFCDSFDRTTLICTYIDIKVSENGVCDLFSLH